MDIIERQFAQITGGRVLDVATAEGGFIDLLKESLASYTEFVGIDIIGSKLLKARQKHEGDDFSFLEMDGASLAFEDDSFDTVAISYSLHHLPDIPMVLQEMKRVLRPGGRFIIFEMFRDDQTPQQMVHVDLHHWWAKINRLEGVTHNTTMTRSEIIDHAKQLGLASYDALSYVDPETDPEDAETRTYLEKVIDEYLEKLDDSPDHRPLREEGEQLRHRIAETGIAWATTLVVIGVK